MKQNYLLFEKTFFLILCQVRNVFFVTFLLMFSNFLYPLEVDFFPFMMLLAE